MRRIPSIAVALFAFATSAAADEIKLTGAEIKVLLSDRTMTGVENRRTWEQIFQRAGATFYSVGAAQSQGLWDVRGNQYCSVWPPSTAWACYDMARDGDAYVFISSSGERTQAKLLK